MARAVHVRMLPTDEPAMRLDGREGSGGTVIWVTTRRSIGSAERSRTARPAPIAERRPSAEPAARPLPAHDPALAARVERLLSDQHVVWLSTVRPDGHPHLIPIWFVWDGSRIVIFSKPEASKVANLRRHPRVMLAVGDPEHDFDVQLIEGDATALEASTADVITPEHARKYGELMARIGLTREEYARTYSQPIVVRPTRFLPWGGRGHAERGYRPDGPVATQERV